MCYRQLPWLTEVLISLKLPFHLFKEKCDLQHKGSVTATMHQNWRRYCSAQSHNSGTNKKTVETQLMEKGQKESERKRDKNSSLELCQNVISCWNAFVLTSRTWDHSKTVFSRLDHKRKPTYLFKYNHDFPGPIGIFAVPFNWTLPQG